MQHAVPQPFPPVLFHTLTQKHKRKDTKMPGELSPLFENQEELETPITAVTLAGTILNWIHGTYLRVGPGIYKNLEIF